jgi:hypothetical protein
VIFKSVRRALSNSFWQGRPGSLKSLAIFWLRQTVVTEPGLATGSAVAARA